MSDRRAYLLSQRAMGLATPEELQELSIMPLIIRGDAGAVMVCPAPIVGATDDERAANFLVSARAEEARIRERTP